MPFGNEAQAPMAYGSGGMQRDRITQALMNIQSPPPVTPMPQQAQAPVPGVGAMPPGGAPPSPVGQMPGVGMTPAAMPGMGMPGQMPGMGGTPAAMPGQMGMLQGGTPQQQLMPAMGPQPTPGTPY